MLLLKEPWSSSLVQHNLLQGASWLRNTRLPLQGCRGEIETSDQPQNREQLKQVPSNDKTGEVQEQKPNPGGLTKKGCVEWDCIKKTRARLAEGWAWRGAFPPSHSCKPSGESASPLSSLKNPAHQNKVCIIKKYLSVKRILHLSGGVEEAAVSLVSALFCWGAVGHTRDCAGASKVTVADKNA